MTRLIWAQGNARHIPLFNVSIARQELMVWICTQALTLQPWRPQVSKAPLTALRLQENGRIAAVGAADGSTSVLRLSDSLAEMQPNEKYAVTSVRRHLHLTLAVLRLSRGDGVYIGKNRATSRGVTPDAH